MNLKSAEISALKNNENPYLEEIKSKEVLIQIGPTNTLSTSNVLKWTVRAVESGSDHKNCSSEASASFSSTVLQGKEPLPTSDTTHLKVEEPASQAFIDSNQNTPPKEIAMMENARPHEDNTVGIQAAHELAVVQDKVDVQDTQHAPNTEIPIGSNQKATKAPTPFPLHVHLDDVPFSTPLTRFFEMNSMQPDGSKYLFSEFPKYYVWDVGTRQWKQRKKGSGIGNLIAVDPSEGERYYLYLLLSHVHGPTSFEDLMTVEGQACTTFKEAAIKRGLVDNADAA